MSGARLFSLLGLGLVLASCGRDVPDSGGGAGDLSLFIDPPAFDLYLGQEFTFDVVLTEDEPKSVLDSPDLSLELGKPGIVELRKNGTGTAKAAGKTAAIAAYLGFEAEASVDVRDGRLVAIEVIPTFVRLQIGQTTQLRVTGTLDNGQQLDLSRGYQGTTYQSSDASIASITEDGLVRGEKLGRIIVAIAHGRFTAQAEIEVSDQQVDLQALFIQPDNVSLEYGQTFQLGVFGIDAAGNQVDILANLASYALQLSSSDPGIAAVSGTGLLTAQKITGVTTVFAQVGDLTASAEVRVRPSESELVDLFVEPEATDVPEGGTVQIRVTGRYLDGSTADLTAGATGTTYFSSDLRGFSVGNDGLITGLTQGISGFVIVNHGIFERLVFVNVVGDAELIGIEVRPPFVDLMVGGFIQLQVIAFYSDGNSVDVTSSGSGVVYIPPREGFVTVTPDGFVQANFPGAGNLIVQYRGFEVFVPISVIEQGQVVAIFISPPFISLPEGQITFIQIFAQLIDGSIIDITFDPQLVVSVDRLRIAGYLGGGIVEGRSAGLTTLRATYFGLTAQADIEVVGMRTLVGLELSIPPQIGVNQSVPYAVLALYSDGTVQDVTFDPQTQVVSVDPMILDVFFGQATGLNPGFTTVIADHQGFSDSVTVEVTLNADPIVALNFQPSTLNIPVNGTGTAFLIAVHQSGMITDVTFDPGVVYSPRGPISIGFGAGLDVTGFAPGPAEVTATLQGLTARLTVNVGMMNTIVGIDIVAPARMDANSSEMFIVVAFFSDGSFSDITFDPALMLSSSNTNVLSVSPGTLFGNAPGSANLTANYQGFTDVWPITVGADPVIALEFVPSTLTMELGVQASAQVFATFQSGRRVNVTFDPNLNVNFNGPISISPGTGSNILIDAFGVGNASITVDYEGLTATLPITIQSTRTVVGIMLLIVNPLGLGMSAAYEVIATFSDGSTQDITFDPGVTISVSNPMILTASNGVATGRAVGQTTVTVTYMGFQESEVVRVVNNDPIVGLAWNPSQLSLQIGGSMVARVFAVFQSGNSLDVTRDPATTFSRTGPISTMLVANGLQVTGNAQGNGQVDATYMGFTAGLPVTVGNAPELTGIRVEPANVQLAEGDSIQLVVIGIYSDGSEMPITGAQFFNFDPSIADVSPTGLVTAISAGTGGVIVSFGNFGAFVQIDVFSTMGPTITSIDPEAVVVGSPATPITVTGTGFSMGDAIFVGGTQLTTRFNSPTQLTAQIPSFLLQNPGTLDVQVRGANGRSNIVPLFVGEIPVVTSYSPDSLLQGSSVEVTVIGTGLSDLTYSAMGLTVTEIEAAADGTWLRLRVTAGANVMPGMYTVTLANTLGMDSILIEVLTMQNLPDLVVNSGQTVTLSGTNVYANVTVQTGGRIIGAGLDTLAIIASNSIIIRGTIDVSGDPGQQGFTTPAAGGDSGPGGGGGGGGGDGNAMIPAAGGAGSPPGFDAQPGQGQGTPGGDGGGEGGGGGGAFGCGHGGGGGGLEGNGGNGGGDFGDGTGGFGGFGGGRGSQYGDGTGGGGGSTCGGASGGGGGGGGGGLILQVAPGGSILIDGEIRANGGIGGDGFQNTGGGGGGSGGRVEVIAPNGTITINDTISAQGGDGGDTDFGDTGGGGGGGLISIDATGGTVNIGFGLLDVDPGQPGASLGGGFAGEIGSAGTTSVVP